MVQRVAPASAPANNASALGRRPAAKHDRDLATGPQGVYRNRSKGASIWAVCSAPGNVRAAIKPVSPATWRTKHAMGGASARTLLVAAADTASPQIVPQKVRPRPRAVNDGQRRQVCVYAGQGHFSNEDQQWPVAVRVARESSPGTTESEAFVQVRSLLEPRAWQMRGKKCDRRVAGSASRSFARHNVGST